MAWNQGLTDATSSIGQVVRVTIPASLFHNLDGMQRVTKQVLGQLGCEACHSGYDIRYDVIRQFVVDEKGQLQSALGGGANPPANPAPSGGKAK